MPSLDARTRRIIAQHARTTQLLGVDFMPVHWCDGGDDEPTQLAEEPIAAPVASEIEAKPKPGVPAMSVRTSPAVAYRPIDIPAGETTPEQARQLLDEIRRRYEHDAPHQHFVTAHTNIVFGEGHPRAELMFVGEAPGENEDRTGRPFVGRAGELLDKMIVAMGLSRAGVYICNVLKTRPPNNQTPTSEEAERCLPYLLDQIRVVSPKVIVTLGLPATKLLLSRNDTMRAMRGRFHDFPPPGDGFGGAFSAWGEREPVPVMPTYHPAYLLRSYTPDNRRKVWSDLQMAMEKIGTPGVS